MPRKTDWDFHNKAIGNIQPPVRAAIPFHPRPQGWNPRPADSGKGDAAPAYPGFWPKSLAGAGPVLLLAIALLCTFYPSLHKKPAATPAKPKEPSRSESSLPPSSAVQLTAKPSPVLVQVRSTASTRPEQPVHAVPASPGLAVQHNHSIQYLATHKRALGGCTGQLELTSTALRFRCSHQAELDIPVSLIAGTHKDGVVLASGEKYHFLISNYTKGQVEMIFSLWLDSARQAHQPSRQSSF